MITPDSPYREIGDVSFEEFEAELARVSSPMLVEAKAIYDAVSPHSALFLGQSWLENQHATTGAVLLPAHRNNMGLRPWFEDPNGLPPGSAGTLTAPDGSFFLRFRDWASCAREWKRRLFDDPAYKGGVYTRTATLRDMLSVYAPKGDIHPVTGVDNADVKYAETVCAVVNRIKKEQNMAITFGRVPKPPIQNRILSNSEAVEGRGWDNLGKRDPRFIVLHRMVGTLWGTDGYFRNPSVASLTDFGIGIAAKDGAANAGKILQWNDYYGYRSGWASGPVSKPYGDGLAAVNKYGVNGVNRFGVSVEISGTNEPLDAKSWGELVKLCSWLADTMKVPYSSLPLNPNTGFNLMIWHQEFTIGTGKTCPFQWMMDNTMRLYEDMRSYMKPFQEGTSTPAPAPKPTPPPAPAGKKVSVNWFVPLREAPGFAAKVIRSKVEPYVEGTLLEGPIDKDGVKWYKIDFKDVGTGWVHDRITRTLNLP